MHSQCIHAKFNEFIEDSISFAKIHINSFEIPEDSFGLDQSFQYGRTIIIDLER